MKANDFPQIMTEAIISTTTVMVILTEVYVFCFSYYLSWERVFHAYSAIVVKKISSKYVFLLAVSVLILVLGMFLDGTISMIVLAPLFAPSAQGYC